VNKDNLIAFYEADLARYGPEDARSLHWTSARTQRTRFEVLYDVGPWEGVSVADIGSGLGDFAAFLASKGHRVRPGPGPGFTAESAKIAEKENFNKISAASAASAVNQGGGVVWYNGYDISAAMVKAARQKHPNASFHLRDILTEGFIAPADYIIASGTFNIRIEDHDRWFREMLATMYGACRRAVAFNFLDLPPDFSKYGPQGAGGTRDQRLETKDSVLAAWHSLYYEVDPDEVLEYCRTLSPNVSTRTGYLPGDYTVYMYRD